MKGRTEDELAVLRPFVSEQPDSAFAHLDLAGALERAGSIEEGLEYCLNALALDPTLEDALRMEERLEDS
jgi:tetratricopeptide (TPR) repeat protein